MKRGLIIKKENLDNIFDHGKIWEMRSTMTNIRGEIELIEAGSGFIVGHCILKRCYDLSEYTPRQLINSPAFDCHRVSNPKLLEKWNKAWVLNGAKRYEKPIPYKHPQGAVIWVKL